MVPPERHQYDLYLRAVGEDTIAFAGRSRLYAGWTAIAAAGLAATYLLFVRHLPFENLAVAAHLVIAGAAGMLAFGAAGLMLRRESLSLSRRRDEAVYEFASGADGYRWEAPLSAFSAVSAEIVAQSDGKAIGRRHWAFYLHRWDGARIRFHPSRFASLPASKSAEATQVVRAMASFLGCEARIVTETRIMPVGETDAPAEGAGDRSVASPSVAVASAAS